MKTLKKKENNQYESSQLLKEGPTKVVEALLLGIFRLIEQGPEQPHENVKPVLL